jgi:hypothetical protein
MSLVAAGNRKTVSQMDSPNLVVVLTQTSTIFLISSSALYLCLCLSYHYINLTPLHIVLTHLQPIFLKYDDILYTNPSQIMENLSYEYLGCIWRWHTTEIAQF